MDLKDALKQAIANTGAAIELAQEEKLDELMGLASYQRDAERIIRAALDDGLDVLQLPNGDIVTTGTKVVVTTYSWDGAKQQLTKQRAPVERSRLRRHKPNSAA